MRLDVLAEVVRAHEPLVADGAGEALLTRVRAEVPLELVRAREALPAEQPVADEGPLAGVPPQVSLQVRRLAVHLAAAGDVAGMDAPLSQVRPCWTQPLRLLAVGAVAGGAAGVATLGAGRLAAAAAAVAAAAAAGGGAGGGGGVGGGGGSG